MIHTFKRGLLACAKALFVSSLLGIALGAIGQTYFHGNPKILQPNSGAAPAGYMHTDCLYVNPAYLPPNFGPGTAGSLVPTISPGTTTPPPYAPLNIQQAYNIPSSGGGDAIALVDAYDLSTALSDFNTFSSQFGLPQETSSTVTASTNQVFQVVYASGSQPGSSVPSGWNIEEALDIEWAHSLAPNAKIYLVEANSPSGTDLYAADQVAAALPGVKEVSNSWGGNEYSGEASDDSTWVYSGVSFFFSTGDDAVQEFPAESANVVAVGGTSLNMTWNGSGTNWDGSAYSAYASETGWSGSGGGPSAYESRPSFQNPVQNFVGASRGDPDCSAVADPNTGVYVYTTSGGGAWYEVGGTSLACPVTAGITNAREFDLNNFSTGSQNEELRIYNNAMSSFYRDITGGGTTNESCAVGWDYVTGIGTAVGLLSPWSSLQGNVPANGNGIGSGAVATTLRWYYPVVSGQNEGYVIGANNRIYLTASGPGGLFALDAETGISIWNLALSAQGTPALDSLGNLFVLASTGILYSINAATGIVNWTFTAAASVSGGSPVVGTGDIVYFGDSSGDMYAINGSSGDKIWSATANSGVTTPALDTNGFVYFVSTSGTLYSLDAGNGNAFWTAAVGPVTTSSSPVIGPNETVYLNCSNNDVYAINIETGIKAWSQFILGGVKSCPAVAPNGTVYVNTGLATLTALNGTTGATLWSASTSSVCFSSPAIGADGTVYAANDAGTLLAINGSTGVVNWSDTGLSTFQLSSPAIGADGTVYTSSTDGDFYALGTVYANISLTTPETGATSQTATLTLAEAAQENITVLLASSNSNVTVPASVNLTAGQTAATFSVDSSNVSTQQLATITAKYVNAVASTTLTVNPNPISSFSTSPSTVSGGDNSGIVLNLAGPAGPSGDVVSMSTLSSLVNLPATVTIPAGDTTYTHGFSTSVVSTPQQVTLTATFNGNQTNTTITLEPFGLSKFVTAPSSVTAGQSTGGVVELAGGAGSSGNVISLSSNNSAVTVPPTTTVAAGKTESTFTINTSPVLTTTQVTLTASFNGAQLQTTLTLTPGKAKLAVSPTSVTGGANSGGAVELPISVSSSTVISLSSNNSAATVPSSVTVTAGQTSASFQIGTSAVSAPTNVTITASIDNTSLQSSLTVEPHGIVDFATLLPATVVEGTPVTLQVTLSGVAGSPNGNVVSLQSSNAAVTVPTTVTVPAGQTSYSFPVTTNTVSVVTKVTITATFNGGSFQTTVTVKP